MKKRNRAKWLGTAVAGSVILIGLLLVLMYLMAVHVPADYRPEPVPNDSHSMQTLRNKTDHLLAERMYNKIQDMKPFIFRLDADYVNDLLMLDRAQANDVLYQFLKGRHWVSDQDLFREPQVRFADGEIAVCGRVTVRGRSTVLTVVLAVRLAESGNINVSLDQIKLGVLPVPMEKILATLRPRLTNMLRSENGEHWSKQWESGTRDLVMGLVENRTVQLHGVFQADDLRQVRVEGLGLNDGCLELLLQPEPLANQKQDGS